jgi:prepilin-type processing-associated H-X9-DG protein
MKTCTHHRHGLSMMEVVLVIATAALLAGLLLPKVAGTRHPSSRIGCMSNLKQIGLAYRIFANDHEEQFPAAQFPFAVAKEAGGTLEFENSPQVFRHFEALSNQLNSPKVLVCPTDNTKIRAQNFETSLSNSNISYFVGLDAREDKPQRILSGDRNVTGGVLNNGFMRVFQSNSVAGCTTALHNNAGNIGLADGSAQQVTTIRFQGQLHAQDLPVVRLAIP